MSAVLIHHLDQPVTSLPRIGQSYGEKLKKLHIHTLNDLLHHYPFRYFDASSQKTINQLSDGETVSISGTILAIKSAYLRSGKTIQRASFTDGTGDIPITWFNQPYLVKTLTQHPYISISGKVKRFGNKLTISAPQYELRANDSSPDTHLHTARLVPVYPQTAGITSKWLRTRINQLLPLLPDSLDPLPTHIREAHHLITLPSALKYIHFPKTHQQYEHAKKRLSFDELLTYQLLSQTRKRLRQTLPNQFPISSQSLDHTKTFVDSLPFRLTPGQNQAIQDILADLNGPTPMNRLIQGDVGSGKTAVAAAAAAAVIQSGYHVVFMVPTETLALQHYKNLIDMCQPLDIAVGIATKSQKHNLSKAHLIIGTHAVLHRQLPQPIGLVIIDEQHRFGVKQRAQLINPHTPPHVLSLTATPIPRTIALTLYAELDITTIRDMPPGRLPVKTFLVSHNKRQSAYQWIKTEIARDNQAYVVCPLIFEQEDPGENEIKSAETEYRRLTNEIFPDLSIGLIHGKLSSKEKNEAITRFNNKTYDILVATPVIEVGIDIKDATIMVIEGADRFGLASLHQLRGRVGRGTSQSYCLLFTSTKSPQSLRRLKELQTHHNGLELAEIDLSLRGQGDLYGLKQSGHIELKIASLHDLETIQQSHQAAQQLLDNDPHLTAFPKLQGLCYNT